MDHEPRPPQGNAGLMQLLVVCLQGRRVAAEPETRYSIFHRLTSGALPVVAVQLPGKLSTFMLARSLTVDGKMEQLVERAREVCKVVAIPEGVRTNPQWSIEGARTGGLPRTPRPSCRNSVQRSG